MTIHPCIFVLLLGCGLGVSQEEEESNAVAADADNDDEDVYIIGFLCALFAILMSFMAVIIGHYSWLEDSLMKEYLQKAVVHEATVLTAEFSRAATTTKPTTSCVPEDPGQSEYVARVEYRVPVPKSKQKMMIRKQVKVFASDFKTSSGGSSSDIPQAIAIEFASSFTIPTDDHDLESVVQGQEVEVLVMPGYSKSGLPRSQVLRTCSLSYRLPTMGLLLFLLSMASICFYLGAKLSPEVLRPDGFATHELALILFGIVVLAELLMVVGCWGESMNNGVKQIYLEGGEYVRISHDDTTISSGEDSYLRL